MDRERNPEELQPLVGGFRICGTFFEPYETRPQGEASRQRCRCPDKVPSGAKWPGYDVNEHLHLCECCSMVVLPSGSRWSVSFCEECKQRVDELNESVGRCVIPIGRHSLMNGVGVAGRDVTSAGEDEIDAVVAAFLDGLTGLFGHGAPACFRRGPATRDGERARVHEWGGCGPTRLA